MIDIDVITLHDGDYYIIDSVIKDNIKYLLLSKIEDFENILIKKINLDNEDIVLPIESKKEFELACMLLFKKGNEKQKDTKN